MLLQAMSSAPANLDAAAPIDPAAMPLQGYPNLETSPGAGATDTSFSDALKDADSGSQRSDQAAASDRHAPAHKRSDPSGAGGAPVPPAGQIQSPLVLAVEEQTHTRHSAHAGKRTAMEDEPATRGISRGSGSAAAPDLRGRHDAESIKFESRTAAQRIDADKPSQIEKMPAATGVSGAGTEVPSVKGSGAPTDDRHLHDSDPNVSQTTAPERSAGRHQTQNGNSDGFDGQRKATGLQIQGAAASQVHARNGRAEPSAEPFSSLLKHSTSMHDAEAPLARNDAKHSGAGISSAPGWTGIVHNHGMPAALEHQIKPDGLTRDPAGDTSFLSPIAEGVVVRQAALQANQSGSSFRVVLQPETLGVVTVHVARGESGLVVTLAPQQTETQALLDRHLPELVAMLSKADGTVQASVVHGNAAHTPGAAHMGAPMAHSGQGSPAGQGSGQQFTSREQARGHRQEQGMLSQAPLDDVRTVAMPDAAGSDRRANDRHSHIDLHV